MVRWAWFWGSCACLALLGCSQPNRTLPGAADAGQSEPAARPTPEAAAGPEPPFRLNASIRELMDSEVDPAADFIWESVQSISTRAGLEERQPHTDEEWLELRRHVVRLIEAPNLLIMKGRRVSNSYVPAAVLANSTATRLNRRSTANRVAFIALAQRLQDTGLQMLGAVDAKDPARVFELGGDIDDACESCHVTFWYPNLPLSYK